MDDTERSGHAGAERDERDEGRTDAIVENTAVELTDAGRAALRLLLSRPSMTVGSNHADPDPGVPADA